MRGGLDDALDKLARRDELRRRASGQATGTSPAVAELVEAIAGVVARYPALGVTVGADGVGEPVLLHFYFADGQVQIATDDAPAAEPTTTARNADPDIDFPLSGVEQLPASPLPETPAPGDPHDGPEQTDRRYVYPQAAARPDRQPKRHSKTHPERHQDRQAERHPGHALSETSRDLGARMRELGLAGRPIGPTVPTPPAYPPHPFAAKPPPPVPVQRAPQDAPQHPSSSLPQRPSSAMPQGSEPARRPQSSESERPQSAPSVSNVSHDAEPTRRLPLVQHNGTGESSHAVRATPQRGSMMPAPLARPIPLPVERPEDTEVAARRLSALLRDDPSLLRQKPSEQ